MKTLAVISLAIFYLMVSLKGLFVSYLNFAQLQEILQSISFIHNPENR